MFQLPRTIKMLSSVESKIVQAIRKSVKRNWQVQGPANWTLVIKKSLVRLGYQLNHQVRASSGKKPGSDLGEWLFDLCWLRKNSRFAKLELAAEIEWKNAPDDILYDFKKLTVCLASHHLMVIQYHETKPAQLKRVVRLCKNASPRIRGSRYLLIAVPADDWRNVLVYNWKF